MLFKKLRKILRFLEQQLLKMYYKIEQQRQSNQLKKQALKYGHLQVTVWKQQLMLVSHAIFLTRALKYLELNRPANKIS